VQGLDYGDTLPPGQRCALGETAIQKIVYMHDLRAKNRRFVRRGLRRESTAHMACAGARSQSEWPANSLLLAPPFPDVRGRARLVSLAPRHLHPRATIRVVDNENAHYAWSPRRR